MILIEIFLCFNAIVFSIATITTTTTSIQDQIDQLPKSTQKHIFDSLLSTSQLLASDETKVRDDNWCCKTDPGVQASSRTRQISVTVIKYGRHKCGYESCGTFGWSRCTRWCDESWIEVEYRVETYVVYMQSTCPNDQLTCCAQHIFLLGHCFSYTEIYNNQQLFAELHELGIVIPGPSIG